MALGAIGVAVGSLGLESIGSGVRQVGALSPEVLPASYVLYTDGTYYYSQSGKTGSVDYGGPTNLGNANGRDAGDVISKTISGLSGSGGGKIHISAGTFVLTSSIQVSSCTNIMIEGEGYATLLQNQTNANYPVFLGTTPTWLVIRNLRIYGGGSGNNFAHGICCAGSATMCSFENIQFDNCCVAIDLTGAWQTQIHNCRIGHEGNPPQNPPQNLVGIFCHMPPSGSGDNSALTVTNTTVSWTISDGIRLEHFSGSKWTNVEVGHAGRHGWNIGTPSTPPGSLHPPYPCHFGNFVNCLADSCTGDGWHLDGTAAVDGNGAVNNLITDSNFTNCWSGNSQNGFYGIGVANILLIGWLIELHYPYNGNAKDGIRIDAPAAGGAFNYSFRVQIIGCYIENWGAGFAGVHIYSLTKASINGNQFVNPASTRGSIVEESSGGNCIYVFNDLGDATGPAFGSGAYVLHNRGLQPQGVSSITVNSSPFTYTNQDTVPEAIYIVGGTVTQISKNSVPLFQTTNVTLWLEPGESITITSSVSPSMYRDRK